MLSVLGGGGRWFAGKASRPLRGSLLVPQLRSKISRSDHKTDQTTCVTNLHLPSEIYPCLAKCFKNLIMLQPHEDILCGRVIRYITLHHFSSPPHLLALIAWQGMLVVIYYQASWGRVGLGAGLYWRGPWFRLENQSISTFNILFFFFQQVLMVSDKKPEYWISNCTTALKDASRNFSSPSPVNGFYLFESTPYWTKGHADEHETKWETENWLKHKDLIFKDHSSSLEIIPPVTLQGIPVSFMFLMPLFASPTPPPTPTLGFLCTFSSLQVFT